MKICTRCDEEKELDKYYTIQGRWKANICKACIIAAKVIYKKEKYRRSESFRMKTKCWNAGISVKNKRSIAEEKKMRERAEKFCPTHLCWWQHCGCTKPKNRPKLTSK